MLFAAGGIVWYNFIPGVKDGSLFPFAESSHHDPLGHMVVAAFVISFVILAIGFKVKSSLEAAMARPGLEKFEADEGVSLRNIFEGVVGGFAGVLGGFMEKADVARYLPIVVGLFTYIFISNVSGVIPGFLPPTENINANVGMAIVVMLTYWYVGLTRDAKGFVGHMLGPVGWLAPLILLIELIGLVIVRPASLAIRLSGNMFGDHTVFGIMSDLTYIFIPCIFLALAMLVSLIQAGVFSLLSAIYISLSLPHGDHDHH